MDAEKGHINEIVGDQGIDYNWAEFLRLNNNMRGQNKILGKTVLVGTMALNNTMLLCPWKLFGVSGSEARGADKKAGHEEGGLNIEPREMGRSKDSQS